VSKTNYSVYIPAVGNLEARITNFEKKREAIRALKRESNDARIAAKQAQQSLGRAEKR